ncbi:MAG: ATP-binding cassette domain-containing protein [Actinomycetota bacterium]|nr:ATP-binding cassette domain-containing protein [Actinomycetota bacterium]
MEQPTPREELVANIRGLGLVARSSPGLAVGLLATTVVSGGAPALAVAATGRFLSQLPEAVRLGGSSAPGRSVRAALVLIGLAVLVSQLVGPVQQAVLFGLQRKFESYLSRRLMSATVALPGLAYFEDPEFRDELAVAHWIGFGPVHTLQFLTQMFQQLSQLLAMAAVAATYAGWVPVVVVLAAVPGGVASWRFESLMGMARWRRSEDSRRADYYRNLATMREQGKELRIFSLPAWAGARQAAHWLASMTGMWALRRKGLGLVLWLHALAIAGLGLTYLAMLRSAIAGRTSVGRFTAASIAAVGLLTAVVALSRAAAQARRSSFYLPSALQVLGLARSEPRLDIRGTRPAGDRPRTGIAFEGVSFAYPGAVSDGGSPPTVSGGGSPPRGREVLDGLDLWIPAGSSVALVGENGAGKTTLIKLLCRFYDPDEGRITLDGVDVRELDLLDLRRRMAVIFQDFVRYQLPARDNVGFGALEAAAEEPLLREAASRVGILDQIEALPQGWDTPLAREFGGVDLSGGEWQRVALARAMMAQVGRDADLLVLDEPTASLDVRVEHELYGHFAELSRGRTTLLVSHRFSTVRMAGRIVLLAGGRVVEDGGHEELVAAGGRYAELYEVQASHYRMTLTLE